MSSTADTIAPKLSSLTIPKVVNLGSGTAGLTIAGVASDERSGVKEILVWFDKNFTYSFSLKDIPNFSSHLLINSGVYDSWSDGTSSQTWGVATTNSSGVYNVTSVDVKDVQGNIRSYSPSELAAMGVNTSINFINSKPDVTPPQLISLAIPKVVDLSSGTAGLTISGLASDEKSGVKEVLVWFDKDFTYSFSLNDTPNFSSHLLGHFGSYDSWSDGASSQTWGVAATNASGIYNVTRVDVKDVQGNIRSYAPSELAGLGINTSINFINAKADVTPPQLTSLTIPKVIDLSSGTAGLTISGLASDEKSGVKEVLVWFDKDFTYSFSLNDTPNFSSHLLGHFGSYDSWSDGASSQTWGIASTNSSGIYNVTSVDVKDIQGNTRSYSPSELAALGVNTSIWMVNKSVLTSADDSWVGTVNADWVVGAEGNDRLNGLGGDDVLEGGNGNDVLDGGTGSDKLTGGLGNDTYYVDNASDVVSETSASGGIDTVIASVSRTLGSYQENLILSGTAAINGTGNTLANTLTGNSAANVLDGGAGDDILSGGAGDDRLIGGAGNDRLIGGAGKDVLTGGAGNDIFDFNAPGETGLTSPIWDVITDFMRGSDKIDLATLDANTATAANDAFGAIIGSTTTFTAAGQLKVANGVLYGNTDSDSIAEFAIQLTGITSLTTADFIL